MSEDEQSGWGRPINSRKSHFFVKKQSLCAKWAFFGSVDSALRKSSDDCAVCRSFSTRSLCAVILKNGGGGVCGRTARHIAATGEIVCNLHIGSQKNPRPSMCRVSASFFEEQSPEASYLLGLLWADGHFMNNLHHPSTIRLEMVENDLGSLLYIFERSGKWTQSRRTRPNRQPQLCLSTSNKQLYGFLTEFGYLNRLDGPTFPLNSHWFRGLFDGDGCIYVGARSLKQVSIAGPVLQDWTFLTSELDRLDIEYIITTCASATGHGSTVRFQGRNPCMRFGEFLYGEATFGLARKREKFLRLQAPVSLSHSGPRKDL